MAHGSPAQCDLSGEVREFLGVGSISRSPHSFLHRSDAYRDLLGRLLGNAWEKDYSRTARAALSRHDCDERVRILRIPGDLFLIIDAPCSVLEHLLLRDAKQLLKRLRQRLESLARLAGDHGDGSRCVLEDRRARIL